MSGPFTAWRTEMAESECSAPTGQALGRPTSAARTLHLFGCARRSCILAPDASDQARTRANLSIPKRGD